MSVSRLIAAMDEVAGLIRDHDWSGIVDTAQLGGLSATITTSREYRPAHSLDNLRSVLVEVCLPRKLRERAARGIWADKYLLCVGITAPLPPKTPKAAADQWMALADAITDFVTLAAYSFGSLETIEEKPTADVGQIDADSVFTRVLVVKFQSNQVIT